MVAFLSRPHESEAFSREEMASVGGTVESSAEQRKGRRWQFSSRAEHGQAQRFQLTVEQLNGSMTSATGRGSGNSSNRHGSVRTVGRVELE